MRSNLLNSHFIRLAGLLLFLDIGLSGPTSVYAHGPEESVLEEIIVLGRRLNLAGEARSASEGVVGQEDLSLRPLLRPGDVLESIPGMIMTQHSASGKGNQMFLRGFNLDHGTDFSTKIDGMPINLPTHGHGQGYTDVNFLIPELIRTIDYVKGPYHAELGDFSSAGGAHIRTFQRLPEGQLTVGIGENGYGRFLAAGGGDVANGHQFSQVDERTVYGGDWNRTWRSDLTDSHLHHSLGVQLRHDDIDPVGLIKTRERTPVSITRLDKVRETSLGAYYELRWDFRDNWRSVRGIRADQFWFDVDSDTPDNSGSESDGIISPKASLIYGFTENSEVYLSSLMGGSGLYVCVISERLL